MRSVEQLIEASKDPRLAAQSKWVRELVHDLAFRMNAEHRYAKVVEERAEKEVGEARALLLDGPEGSDTYLDLPRSFSVNEEGEQRPLGRGASVEFRAPDEESGEGIMAQRTEDGSLKVTGCGPLAVVPQSSHTILIEKR